MHWSESYHTVNQSDLIADRGIPGGQTWRLHQSANVVSGGRRCILHAAPIHPECDPLNICACDKSHSLQQSAQPILGRMYQLQQHSCFAAKER